MYSVFGVFRLSDFVSMGFAPAILAIKVPHSAHAILPIHCGIRAMLCVSATLMDLVEPPKLQIIYVLSSMLTCSLNVRENILSAEQSCQSKDLEKRMIPTPRG
ncbi:MAG: hypothetical protein OEV24_21520, partial [Cyclobacteriaceae bacterium]|nr:hypothetical protein [Cyclobacteriaceae bacterium]